MPNPNTEIRIPKSETGKGGEWQKPAAPDPVRVSDFSLPSAFGFRISDFGFASPALWISGFLVCLGLTVGGAAIPAPEQILPDDTLLLLTAPDYGKLHEIWQRSPKNQLWNDPAMKPLHDKFLSRWQEEVVKPIEQDLGLRLDTFASLPQGPTDVCRHQERLAGRRRPTARLPASCSTPETRPTCSGPTSPTCARNGYPPARR